MNKFIDVVLVVVERIVGGDIESEQFSSEDKQSHKNDELVNNLADDIPPHGSVNDLCGFRHWLKVHKNIMRWLSR